MNETQQQARRVIAPIDQPLGAEGAFLLLLRRYLLDPNKDNADAVEAFGPQVGFQQAKTLLQNFGRREWAKHFVMFGALDDMIHAHIARLSPAEREETGRFFGKECKARLWEVSPFQGQTLVVFEPPLGRVREGDNERSFFRAIVVRKNGSYDQKYTYFISFPGWNADKAEVFGFIPDDLEFRIPC